MANETLALFLAHPLELESEALERYRELVDILVAHHNSEVVDFFQRMADEARHHLAEVHALSEGLSLPQIKAWEFNWPDSEPPEPASYEAVHYRMSLRKGIELALENERSAERYYWSVAKSSHDLDTVKVATQFVDEEMSHEAALLKMLEGLPENEVFHHLDDDEPHIPE